MTGSCALQRLIRVYGWAFHSVIDVGSGPGKHADAFRLVGKAVTTVDLAPPADYVGDFMALPLEDILYARGPFGAVWCSHVLEHQRNVGAFLERCRALLAPGGVLAVTVPPLKHAVVGGHLTLWNAGVLLYNLILAGFDCSAAEVLSEGYDVSVIVRYSGVPVALPPLSMDCGDIERLAPFFPFPVHQGFDGRVARCRWPPLEAS